MLRKNVDRASLDERRVVWERTAHLTVSRPRQATDLSAPVPGDRYRSEPSYSWEYADGMRQRNIVGKGPSTLIAWSAADPACEYQAWYKPGDGTDGKWSPGVRPTSAAGATPCTEEGGMCHSLVGH